ncbi:MAG TPA: hypothetical protein VNG90_05045 [Candidatus Acidoferrum sp.]|nr:hypothetical protein [Candidatus Acidoferrum sp.]
MSTIDKSSNGHIHVIKYPWTTGFEPVYKPTIDEIPGVPVCTFPSFPASSPEAPLERATTSCRVATSRASASTHKRAKTYLATGWAQLAFFMRQLRDDVAFCLIKNLGRGGGGRDLFLIQAYVAF